MQHATPDHFSSSVPLPGSDAPVPGDVQACIANCATCAAVCRQTVQHCLSKGGAHVAVAHIQLLLDCIDICETSASFMLRGSPRHHLICGACAEVCQSCATSCEAMSGDAAMQYCADVCRRCAGSCGAMSRSRAPS
jgi:hypothetical protein